MKKTACTLLILMLFAGSLASAQLVSVASANPQGSAPQLAMPIEHINYTIARINGILWAKIDGEYPIQIQRRPDCAFSGELPMVYPMPPDTTNIHVWLGDRELGWSNYTEIYPEALHHTAIGDWWMIHSVLDNIEDSFVLKIHYEHPLERVNGSHMFLYDLNISPYLSEQNKTSTAYFTVRLEANTTDLQAYTAPPDSFAVEWQPKPYTTTTEGSLTVVSIEMYSEYSKLVADQLPGDLVVVFSEAEEVPEFSLWTVAVLSAVVLLAALLYAKRRVVVSSLRLSKTATFGNTLV